MSCAPNKAPKAQTEPFTFAAGEGFAAGAKSVAMMWSVPLRAMMIVMSEAAAPRRR